MKKIIAVVLTVCTFLMTLSSCGILQDKEQEFYDLVVASQEMLDVVADDIYNNWYDCIYEDEFLESIDYAIACAFSDNEEVVDKIEENHEKIKNQYRSVRDGKLQTEVKAVIEAYNEYYSFVIEVSGSFKTFSAEKETKKKQLSTALKNLEMEL